MRNTKALYLRWRGVWQSQIAASYPYSPTWHLLSVLSTVSMINWYPSLQVNALLEYERHPFLLFLCAFIYSPTHSLILLVISSTSSILIFPVTSECSISFLDTNCWDGQCTPRRTPPSVWWSRYGPHSSTNEVIGFTLKAIHDPHQIYNSRTMILYWDYNKNTLCLHVLRKIIIHSSQCGHVFIVWMERNSWYMAMQAVKRGGAMYFRHSFGNYY